MVVSITINPTNDPPVAVDDSAEVDENESVSIDVLSNDTDIEGDVLDVGSVVTPPQHGTATIDGDSITYTPDPDWDGLDSFTYTASDGSASSNTATVDVTVYPVILPEETVTVEEEEISASVSRLSDGEGKRYTFEAISDHINGDSVLFVPEGDGVAAYRAFLNFGPKPVSGGPLVLSLQYDPTGGTTYQPVEWCTSATFDDDGNVTDAVLPVGESWCVANADTHGVGPGMIETTWQVYGLDDPRFQ